MIDHWLILRTSGRNTLKLADQLIKEGFDAWAPKRTFAKKGNGEMLTLTAPMLPSFAFARAHHVHALLAKSNEPVKSCPDFSVFHYLDRIALVADGELAHLRKLEEREKVMARRRKPKVRFYSAGETVKIEDGAWAGLSGIVTRDNGKYAWINIGLKEVKISTSLLEAEQILCPITALPVAA